MQQVKTFINIDKDNKIHNCNDVPWHLETMIIYNVNFYEIKLLIESMIGIGIFRYIATPKVVAENLKAKNSKDTLVYSLNIYDNIECYFLIKKVRLEKKYYVTVTVCTDHRNVYEYYKTIFVLANLFKVRIDEDSI